MANLAKDLKKLMAEYRAKGWRIEPTNKSQSKWFSPNGKDIIVASGTPSDQRALHNHVALLKRSEKIAAQAHQFPTVLKLPNSKRPIDLSKHDVSCRCVACKTFKHPAQAVA